MTYTSGALSCRYADRKTTAGTGKPPVKTSFAELFREAEARFGLPKGLVKAVAVVESGLNPKAVSEAGALGLMQLMPATAKSLGVSNPLDPVQNVEGAARYLRHLLDQFHGNLTLALAAYNAGPGAVSRFGGVPPYAETRAYVSRVLKYMKEGTEESVGQSCPNATSGNVLRDTTNETREPIHPWNQDEGASSAEAILAALIRFYAENALRRAALEIGRD